MSRGGARTTGLVLPHNTSGLNGIRFVLYRKKRRGRAKSRPTVHVCAAVGNKRPARSVTANGELEALRQIIKLRTDAGLPAPTLRQAAKALRAFMEATL